MAESYSDNPGRAEKSTPSARLDGWKDIAAYLGKAERTVKRWEASRGLPIHRVPGGAKASVYAFPAELNDWLKSSIAAEPDPVETVQIQQAEEVSEAPLAPQKISAAEAIPDPPPAVSPIPRPRWATAILGFAAVGLA